MKKGLIGFTLGVVFLLLIGAAGAYRIERSDDGGIRFVFPGGEPTELGVVKSVSLTATTTGLAPEQSVPVTITRVGNVVTLFISDFAGTMDAGGGDVQLENFIPEWAQPDYIIQEWTHYQATLNSDSTVYTNNVMRVIGHEVIFYCTDRSNCKPSTTFDLLCDKVITYTVD